MKRTVGINLEVQVSLRDGQSERTLLDTIIGDILERYPWVDGVVYRGIENYNEEVTK